METFNLFVPILMAIIIIVITVLLAKKSSKYKELRDTKYYNDRMNSRHIDRQRDQIKSLQDQLVKSKDEIESLTTNNKYLKQEKNRNDNLINHFERNWKDAFLFVDKKGNPVKTTTVTVITDKEGIIKSIEATIRRRNQGKWTNLPVFLTVKKHNKQYTIPKKK